MKRRGRLKACFSRITRPRYIIPASSAGRILSHSGHVATRPLRGSVDVSKRDAGPLASLGPSELFGEMFDAQFGTACDLVDSPQAVAEIARFWESLGCLVRQLPPEEHDEIAAFYRLVIHHGNTCNQSGDIGCDLHYVGAHTTVASPRIKLISLPEVSARDKRGEHKK